MKQKILIVVIVCITGVCNLKCQTLSLSGGIGLPMGPANYPKTNFPDAALFSNYTMALSGGLDFTFKSSHHYGFGIHIKYNKYFDWKAENISDRFVNSSLHTFDLGPVFYVNIKRLTSENKVVSILVVPFMSYVKFSNSNTIYNLHTTETLNNGSVTMTFQKRESLSKLTQILPGIMVALDWSRIINEKARLFVRPELTFMATRSGNYPDKFVLMPSITFGYTFDYSRDKRFFIKEIK
jgi:hypothetical protein